MKAKPVDEPSSTPKHPQVNHPSKLQGRDVSLSVAQVAQMINITAAVGLGVVTGKHLFWDNAILSSDLLNLAAITAVAVNEYYNG